MEEGGVLFIASGPILQQKVEDPSLLKGFNWRVQDCILQLLIGNGVVSIQMLKNIDRTYYDIKSINLIVIPVFIDLVYYLLVQTILTNFGNFGFEAQLTIQLTV